MPDLSDIKAKICEVGRLVHQRGYVSANSGNISVRLDDGTVLITPTGVSKGTLRPSDIAHITMDCEPLDEDPPKVSSETRMHLAIFRADEGIRAVVHTHSQSATYMSMWNTLVSRPISADIIIQVGNIPVAPYRDLGTESLADAAAQYAANYNAVLLANHGAVTFGRTLDEAYLRTEAVENFCSLLLLDELHGNKAELLSADAVRKLIATRESLGVKKGGFPPELDK